MLSLALFSLQSRQNLTKALDKAIYPSYNTKWSHCDNVFVCTNEQSGVPGNQFADWPGQMRKAVAFAARLLQFSPETGSRKRTILEACPAGR